MRRTQSLFAGLAASSLVLGACQSTSQLSTSSQAFVAAANALAQAEADYFDEIQAASDAGYRLQAAEDYVGHNGKYAAIARELSHRDDFSKAKQLRVAVMGQLQNYAQQISAITTGANATWIADDAKNTTTKVSTLLADANIAHVTANQAGLIETAVTDLGRAVIDSTSAKEIKKLAQGAKVPISKIADMVAQDDANIQTDKFAPGLQADQAQAVSDILNHIYNDPQVNAAQRFYAIQTAANWKPSLVTKAQAIHDALAKLQAANDALAAEQPLSAGAIAQQAYALASQALSASASAK